MAEPLLGATAAPPFNLMDMILEGPRGYFGRRGALQDQMWLQNYNMAQQGQAAQTLMGSPQLKAAIANPLDRQAQFNLWATTQGTPLAGQGASWLQQAVGAAYGRESTTFEDKLARSRIVLGTDEALRQAKGMQDLQQQQIQQKWAMLNQPGPDGQTPQQNQMLRDARYNFLVDQKLMRPAPDGFSINAAGNGFEPTIGGAKWQESMGQLEPLQRMGYNINSLANGMDNNTLTTAQAQGQIESIRQDMRLALKMGTLDEGAAKSMDNLLSQYSGTTGFGVTGAAPLVGGQQWLKAREQLRNLKIQNDQNMGSWSRNWNLPLDDPRISNPYATVPGRAAAPKGSADDAVPKIQDKAGGTVGPAREGQGAGTIWSPGASAPASPDVTPSERQQRYKDYLKQKFPKAR